MMDSFEYGLFCCDWLLCFCWIGECGLCVECFCVGLCEGLFDVVWVGFVWI